MKLTVKSVGKPWKPDDAPATFKPIYTLTVEELGEPIRTTDLALAKTGVHEAEEYQNSSGKTYYRTSRAQATGGVNTADSTRSSIERQQALIQAVSFVNGNLETTGGQERISEVRDVFEVFVKLLADEPMVQEKKEEDLVPIELYDNLKEG